MNPNIADEYILCWAEQFGLSGRVMVTFDETNPRGVYEIEMGPA